MQNPSRTPEGRLPKEDTAVEITEVRIKLMGDPNDRLKAFCSVTLDGSFVIRDLKIIQGGKGPFVAMPSRKLTDKCPRCGSKNNLRATYCNDCGHKLKPDRAVKGLDGRAKLYADVAHPINSSCRDKIQECVLSAFDEELILAQQPGYECRYDDYGEDTYAESDWETALDEPGVVPLRVEAGSAETHRLEPPAKSPAGPHNAADPSTRREIAGRIHSERPHSAEGFGEGII